MLLSLNLWTSYIVISFSPMNKNWTIWKIYKCLSKTWMSLHYINWHKAHFKLKTRESWSGDHRYPRIPNFEWGNERNETWFILQLIHFMAIKNLQILVIDNVVNFLLLAKLILIRLPVISSFFLSLFTSKYWL
jgi:hypothetical protein